MKVYLAQSFPAGWGGADRTAKAMKLHLAERDPQHHSWAKNGADSNGLQLRILLSYWYYKDVELDALFAKYFTQPYPDVFADSGAFSAASQRVAITAQEYGKWIQRYQHLFSTYANLDVIGNPQATEENQKRLEGMGLNPLPVFHTGSPWPELEKLIAGYSYIALGGMVPYTTQLPKLMAWLIKCFKMAQGKAVFHGFGATSWKVIRSLPWYSVDSSSWGSGFRYGQVPLFDEQRGKFVEARLGDPPSCYQHAALFRRLGFEPADFADRKRNDRAKTCAVSALSYMMAERWLRRWHGEIQIPQRGVLGAGERLHLSDTSNGINLGDAHKGLRLHLCTAASSNTAMKGGNMSLNALGQARGLRCFLVDAAVPPRDIIRVQEVLNAQDNRHS